MRLARGSVWRRTGCVGDTQERVRWTAERQQRCAELRGANTGGSLQVRQRQTRRVVELQ
jgi:hypothetical protein